MAEENRTNDEGGRARLLGEELLAAAELAGLIGLGVVQPVLGPFGESPETFVAADAKPLDIVWFAVLIAMVPAVLVALAASLTRVFGLRVRSLVQTALVGLLASLAGVAVARSFDIGAVGRVGVALLVGVLAAVAHRRWKSARSFLRWTAPLPLMLLVVFLLASPVASLVRSDAAPVVAAEGGDQAPVLFIVLDELPTASLLDGEGRIDEALVPNLARFANTSNWYRNHTSNSDRTLRSIPTIVTGNLPEGEEQWIFGSKLPGNIIDVFSPTHEVHAVEWISELCPESLCPAETVEHVPEATALLDAAIERKNPLRTLASEAVSLWKGQVWPLGEPSVGNFTLAGVAEADEVVAPGLDFLSGLSHPEGDRPVLDYVHVPLPHQPWTLLPSGATYDGPNPAHGSEFLSWGKEDWSEQLGQAARTRHLLQLQWTDRLLGAIFDRIEELGRWDESVVVLTADHGVSFGAGETLRDATPENQSAIYWTPLFIKAPHQTEPQVIDGNAMSIDIIPTVAELAGVDLGHEVDGVSLVDGVPAGRPKIAHAARHHSAFPSGDRDGLVELDEAEFDRVLAAPGSGDPDDELRLWRHGRHGKLLGRSVSELGVCRRTGPRAKYEPPEEWDAYIQGTLDRAGGLPLWHEAIVQTGGETLDIALVLDGTVVAWNVTRLTKDGSAVAFLLAEPLVDGATGVPELYEVVEDESCQLVPLQQ